MLALYPIDLVTVKLQADLSGKYNGFVDCLFTTIREHPQGAVYGFLLSLVGMVVYRTVYFGLHKYLIKSNQFVDTSDVFVRFALSIAVSIGAGASTYPIDTIRKVAFVNETNPIDAAKQVYEKRGVKGFFTGNGTKIFSAVANAVFMILVDAIFT